MNLIKIFIITITMFFLVLLLWLSLFSSQKKSIPLPVINSVPSPTTVIYPPASVIINEEMKKEKVAEENYANDRKQFLEEKPWVLKLPLKSEQYFISYNPETDTILATIYYKDDLLDKNQQLEIAKQNAKEAVVKIGIDLNNQKITFIETRKSSQ